MRKMGWFALPLVGSSMVGCASTTGPPRETVCVEQGAISLSGGSCVVVSGAVAAHPRGAEVVTRVSGAFGDIRTALGLTEVEVRLSAAGQLVIPEVGVGGYATDRTVDLQVDLDNELDSGVHLEWVEQVLAHELHHVARLRAVGNPRSLGALVTFEGMADRFAINFGGRRVAPWSSAIAGAELTPWIERILDGHPQRDYSVDAWMFGTSPEIPRWTGYSAGYAIVGEYLTLTGRSAATAARDDADDIIARVRSGG
jgi:hypothetical protein